MSHGCLDLHVAIRSPFTVHHFKICTYIYVLNTVCSNV